MNCQCLFKGYFRKLGALMLTNNMTVPGENSSTVVWMDWPKGNHTMKASKSKRPSSFDVRYTFDGKRYR
jgi:hypothetical protein